MNFKNLYREDRPVLEGDWLGYLRSEAHQATCHSFRSFQTQCEINARNFWNWLHSLPDESRRLLKADYTGDLDDQRIIDNLKRLCAATVSAILIRLGREAADWLGLYGVGNVSTEGKSFERVLAELRDSSKKCQLMLDWNYLTEQESPAPERTEVSVYFGTCTDRSGIEYGHIHRLTFQQLSYPIEKSPTDVLDDPRVALRPVQAQWRAVLKEQFQQMTWLHEVAWTTKLIHPLEDIEWMATRTLAGVSHGLAVRLGLESLQSKRQIENDFLAVAQINGKDLKEAYGGLDLKYQAAAAFKRINYFITAGAFSPNPTSEGPPEPCQVDDLESALALVTGLDPERRQLHKVISELRNNHLLGSIYNDLVREFAIQMIAPVSPPDSRRLAVRLHDLASLARLDARNALGAYEERKNTRQLLEQLAKVARRTANCPDALLPNSYAVGDADFRSRIEAALKPNPDSKERWWLQIEGKYGDPTPEERPLQSAAIELTARQNKTGGYIAIASLERNGKISVWRRDTGAVDYLSPDGGKFSVFCFPQVGLLLAGTRDGTFVKYEGWRYQKITVVYEQPSSVNAMAMRGNGTRSLAIGHRDGSVVLIDDWDKPSPRYVGRHRGLRSVALSALSHNDFGVE